MIKVGCCGYPVAMDQYYARFRLVEINKTFYEIPKTATVEKWRETAPTDFEFTVKANKSISHQHKLNTTEPCLKAFEQTKIICKLLKAKILLIQTAASFTPDRLDAAKDFFKTVPRDDLLIIWETRGSEWETPNVRRRLAEALREVDVSHVTDPFKALPAYTNKVAYFRLHGLGKAMYYYQYTNEELEKLKTVANAFEDKGKETYVLFNNLAMFEDAVRFQQFLQKGEFPKITSKVGLDSVKAVVEKTQYPVTKALMHKRLGWRLVELEDGKQTRLDDLIKDLPKKTYKNPEDILTAIKHLKET
ncbi:MAG: DUF72 domain-containing protein [Candidatus Bathyarchaeia archaeon]|nr:DUF72 domain-containing protein [Candidatus Bathyarchaeota archaeon A05DMB-4]MDH7595718.1 DUF72 domain-containing protein [Candidatus Bathyarchaeota archaeon]